MQILGSVCGDRDAMVYTNVIPSDVPQDLYGFVAEKAQVLLRNDNWVSEKMAKYRKIQEKAIKKAMKENRPWNAPEHQDGLTIDPALVTRSTLKRAVMCTSYNAGWGSKNEYIQEQLKEDEVEFSYIDSKLITDASIEALSMAFLRQMSCRCGSKPWVRQPWIRVSPTSNGQHLTAPTSSRSTGS